MIQGFQRVIAAFDVDIRLSGGEKIGRGAFGKNADATDTFEGGEHGRAVGFRIHRARWAFEFAHARVAVDAQEEQVTEVARVFQVGHMAEMQNVEAAVGDDEFFAGVAHGLAPRGQLFPTDNFAMKIHGVILPVRGLNSTISTTTDLCPLSERRFAANFCFLKFVNTPEQAKFIRDSLPPGGLFAGQEWRVSPTPFPLGEKLAEEIESLGRVLLQFNRAVNLLYRKSVEGKQPEWVARWLDLGKPRELIKLQRSLAFKNELPRVIRPDILLTENGISITELDSVPGGIGLTAWLSQTYAKTGATVLGGADGMVRGFESIFGDAKNVRVIVSEEAKSYRPEMEWLAAQIGARFSVHDGTFTDFAEGDAVYRFFELFDLANVANAKQIFELAAEKRIRVTPPPKPMFEEKMLFALLWNKNLHQFWRQELGEGFLARLKKMIPYTWLVDPTPMPPHAAIPELNLTDWAQLKAMSQKERDLILKVSGFSENAWGARGVFLGSDLSLADWSVAVDAALKHFETSPSVLQRFHKPTQVAANWFDFAKNELVPMPGRVRLCPYYFVSGAGDEARPNLGGVLATIVPADKKIVHGMSEAILAPCAV